MNAPPTAPPEARRIVPILARHGKSSGIRTHIWGASQKTWPKRRLLAVAVGRRQLVRRNRRYLRCNASRLVGSVLWGAKDQSRHWKWDARAQLRVWPQILASGYFSSFPVAFPRPALTKDRDIPEGCGVVGIPFHAGVLQMKGPILAPSFCGTGTDVPVMGRGGGISHAPPPLHDGVAQPPQRVLLARGTQLLSCLRDCRQNRSRPDVLPRIVQWLLRPGPPLVTVALQA